jgi:hydroxymethylbilane synthase
MHIKIATRRSKLALAQTGAFAQRLCLANAGLTTELVEFTTRGDQIQDRPLSQVGGKGLFVKELERALLAGEADIAVHSAKDVPMHLPEGLALAFVSPREAPEDAFLSVRFSELAALPVGAKVGTSSLRRAIILQQRFPTLDIQPLRGNVDTRLAKLDSGDYDAIILAAAGLRRLNLTHRITALLSTQESLPAITQGVLAVEYVSTRQDLAAALSPFQEPQLTACAVAERAVGKALQGSCEIPIAAHAMVRDKVLSVKAMIATPDGTLIVRGERSGSIAAAESIGQALGEALRVEGGDVLARAIALSPKDAI